MRASILRSISGSISAFPDAPPAGSGRARWCSTSAPISGRTASRSRAKLDGLVVAIEPSNYAFASLKANAEANPQLLPRLVLIRAALSANAAAPASQETVRFYSRWPLRDGGADRHPKHLGAPAAGAVRFLMLDTLLQE